MKTLLAIVAMVLLSGAAWGQVKTDDPTAWKQTDSLEKCRELEAKGYTIYCGEEGSAWALNQKENTPWAGSRYRLEKNEVTGEYRITEKKGDRWEVIENDYTYDCPNWQLPIRYCKPYPEEKLIKYLERLRTKERENKAWRPIR